MPRGHANTAQFNTLYPLFATSAERRLWVEHHRSDQLNQPVTGVHIRVMVRNLERIMDYLQVRQIRRAIHCGLNRKVSEKLTVETVL